MHTFEMENIAYWSPGLDVVIYYCRDEDRIPDPGIVVIGEIDSGVEAFNIPDSVKATIELIK